jgi:lipopolysaccharide heptosyltransferase II
LKAGSQALERTVIVDPAFLGDVVFDAPLVRAIKARCSDAFVGIVVRPPADAIARAIVGIDRVHVFDKRGSDRGISGIERVARELAREAYTAALIPHPSIRSVLVAARAGIPRRVGVGQGLIARRLLTERREVKPGDTFVEARLRLLGDAARADADLAGSLEVPRPARASGRTRIGLVLGSEWPTKRWSIDRAAAFVSRLDPAHTILVLCGAEKERPLYAELRAKIAAGRSIEIEDAVGGSVDAMVARIASLDVMIAGDTGPLHVARALGIPVIGLFGPTSEARHAFTGRDRVLAVALECRPCSAHGAMICPEGHHRCMKDLTEDAVLEVLVGAVPPLSGERGSR